MSSSALAALRRDVENLLVSPASRERADFMFRLPVIDQALGSGLASGCLHEISSPGAPAAGLGFLVALCAALQKENHRQAVLWCRLKACETETGELYHPGLDQLGFRTSDLLTLSIAKPSDLFWAVEEGLRSSALLAVIAEGGECNFTISRRLQLAAERGGTFGFLLSASSFVASAARTRWRIGPAGHARWRVGLARNRTGHHLQEWELDWDHGALRFRLAAPLADRPLAARPA